jgi:hypothetical protein
LKRLQLIQILCINGLWPAAQRFAMANAGRINPSRRAPNGERRHPATPIPPSDFTKEWNLGLLRFTAR